MLQDATNIALKARREEKLLSPYSPLSRQRLAGDDDETNQVQSLTGMGASEKRPSLNKRPSTTTNEKTEWCILISSNKQFRLTGPFDNEKSLIENYVESERIERSKWDGHRLSLQLYLRQNSWSIITIRCIDQEIIREVVLRGENALIPLDQWQMILMIFCWTFVLLLSQIMII